MVTRNWIAKLFRDSARTQRPLGRKRLHIDQLEDRAVPAAIGFSSLTYTVDEDAGNATITINRTGDTSAASSVTLTATDVSATAGDDYGTVPTTVNFAAGANSAVVQIPIIDDAIFEGDETVTLTLSAPTGGDTLDTNNDEATLTITDNESPNPVGGTIGFSSLAYSVNENGGTATITFTRTGDTTGAASATLSVTGGSATPGDDFGTVPATVNFAAGSDTASVQIPINDDAFQEGDETVALTLSAPTGGAQLDANASDATLTITDDEMPNPSGGTIGFSSLAYSVNEDGGTATITFTRTGDTTGAASATLSVTGGTATAGSDFGTVPTTVNFAAGADSATVQIPITDDSVFEGDETVLLTLSAPTGDAQLSATNSAATLTITDDESPNPAGGTIGFNSLTYSVDEDAGTATITFTRTGDTTGAASATLSVTGGTATAGSDFGTVPTTVNFAAGADSATVQIPITDDSVFEGDETVLLTLSAPTGDAQLSATNSAATLTITDDESPNPAGGTIGFNSLTYSVDEDAGTATITFTRTGTTTGAASATLTVTGGSATSGDDYGTVPTTVNFTAGDTTATVQIPIVDDAFLEGPETLTLSLSAPTGGAQLNPAFTNATLTINDDESPNPAGGTIGFSSTTYTVTEGTANATITLNRTGGTTGSVTVNLSVTAGSATAGADYGTVPATVTFAAGANTATVQIPIVDDALVEGTEAIVLTLSSPTGGAQINPAFSNTVLSIVDNEAGPGASPVAPSTNLLVGGGLNGQAVLFTPDAGAPSYNATAAATIAAFGSANVNIRTAVGDVDGDGVEDLILITGPGTPIRMAVVSGTNNTTVLIPPTAPFAGSENFTGGGFVSSADFDNDGRYEIVATPDQGGGPRVTIFSLVGTTPTVRANFLGIEDPNFRGGARSASGDINGDGIADLAIAAGFQGGPRIAVYNGATVFLAAPIRLAADFFAFEQTLRNGAYVTIGDVNGDGFGDLTFGAGPGGSPRVLTIGGNQLLTIGGQAATLVPLANFFVAGNSTDRGGVRVTAKDADGDNRAEIVVGSGEGQAARVRVYTGATYGGGESAFQDLNVFSGVAITDGVFVG